MRVVVLGSRGQLGHELMSVFGDEAQGLDRGDVDIADAAAVGEVIEAAAPDVVINAAAYTAVDAAEQDEDAATLINGIAVGHIARACAQVEARMVQVSTDYVFDGFANVPYGEFAPPNPQTAYGRSKLFGEQEVLAQLPMTGYIIRTAWLYGAHGANFVKTMLKLEAERDTISVVDDQVGQPTSAADLAKQIQRLIHGGLQGRYDAGIYHGTNSGQTTWFGLTQAIFEEIGADPARVLPCATKDFPRPAPRPAYSVLGHDRWLPGDAMRPWRDSLIGNLASVRAAV